MKVLKLSFFIVLVLVMGGSFAGLTSAGSLSRGFMNAGVSAVATTAVNGGSSANWAGYVAQSGTFTGITGTWTVPAPTVNATTSYASRIAADATWVGIGGVSSRNLIQAGTQALVDPSGAVTYQAWYETLPASETPVPLTVYGGDSITATLMETSTGIWQITLRNNTRGTQYATTVDYASSESSAEWIEEVPTVSSGRRNMAELDNFGSAAFSNAFVTMNGAQVSMANAGVLPITMINNAGQTLAFPTAIGSDGASFTIARSDAASTTSAVASVQPQYVTIGTGQPQTTSYTLPGGGLVTISVGGDGGSIFQDVFPQIFSIFGRRSHMGYFHGGSRAWDMK